MDRPGATPRIVISYARADGEDTARAIAALLTEASHAHAYDHQNLIGGEDWQRQFESWLRSADHLVLVLSPSALRSKHVRWEWTMARAHGLRVSPVRSDAPVHDELVPRWMRQAHQYRLAIPEQRTRLLRELAERTDFRQVRFVAPAADPLYVERAAPLVALKAALLDPNGDPLPATVALHGPAGYGKTALAERLARDPAIREAFCDGILHVQLGRDLGSGQAREDRVKGLLLDLIGKIIGAPPPHFEGLQNAREELATVLDNSVRLIVIDNAWTRGDVEPFLRFGSEDAAARLITTRDLAALPAEATVVEVDEMEPGEARTMVHRGTQSRRVRPARRPAGYIGVAPSWRLAVAARSSKWAPTRVLAEHGTDVGAGQFEQCLGRPGRCPRVRPGNAATGPRGRPNACVGDAAPEPRSPPRGEPRTRHEPCCVR